MGLSSSDRQKVQMQFSGYCIKAIKGELADYIEEREETAQNEVTFSELPENMYPLSTTDTYFQGEYLFEVAGSHVIVKGDRIAEVIRTLPERQRDIILLSYFTGMKDTEISKKLRMVRQTVQYNRISALNELKKYWEEKENEEE